MHAKWLAPLGLIAVAACFATRGTGAFDIDSARPRTDAWAWRSGSSLEIRFPTIVLENAGCMYPDPRETGARRTYLWYAMVPFPESIYQDNHFIGSYLHFTLPDSVSLDETRLDSALASLAITVDEAAGEPPMPVGSLQPRRARAWWDGQAVRLRIDDASALREFLRAGSDSIDIGWCQRDKYLTATRVRLRSRS